MHAGMRSHDVCPTLQHIAAEAVCWDAVSRSATVAVHACLSSEQGETAPEGHVVGHPMQNPQQGPICSDEEVWSCAEPQTSLLASAIASKCVSPILHPTSKLLC